MAVVEGVQLPLDWPWQIFTAEERPDLWEAARPLFRDVWPEYNNHGNDTSTYFGALFPRHSAFQVLLTDKETGRAIARGRSIPFPWDGSEGDLPHGIDAVGLRAVESRDPPTALSALAAEVATDHQGEGLSRLVIQSMVAAARAGGLRSLVAPVRPSWKDRYPLIPIDRYATWTRQDGLPFDPWLRVHARLGGVMIRPEPRSLRIEAPISDWESWTGMVFPDDGDYVFPFGLAPLSVRNGFGHYWEPNVWVLHQP
ncbi:MAG TPA: hypothetical protein VL961_11515 [Acidimicrobiales bacterium]|nr:hypothetical protein [Acidimicrobiales bacterium]